MRIGQYDCVQTRPSMKERVRALREEAIVDAAQDLIISKGYSTLTLDDITEAVGISKPTLYLHFKSKEDIVERISVRCIQKAVDYLSSLDVSRTATDRIQDFISWAVGTRFGDESLLFQDLSRHILPNMDGDSDHGAKEKWIIRSVTSLFESAQAEGGIRDDVPAVMLSAMLLGFIKNYRIDEMMSESNLDQKAIATSWMNLLRKV